MTTEKTSLLPIALYQVMQKYSDEMHILSMNEIISLLEEYGITVERKAISRCIHRWQDLGYPLHFVKGKKQGYCLKSAFSSSETFLIKSLIQDSQAISNHETKVLIDKLESTLSQHVQKQLPEDYIPLNKTNNDDVLDMIEILIPAISENRMVSFQYFDITPRKEKKYRREGKAYILAPYNIISSDGKYYCIFYDAKHGNFANYRLDKMDHVKILEQSEKVVPFSLSQYMQSSFNMYRGEAQTIVLDCKNDLFSQLFDQFGNAFIINDYKEDTFRVSIRTALTPTLISWLMMFSDQLKVISPDSLIATIVENAEKITQKYKGANS